MNKLQLHVTVCESHKYIAEQRSQTLKRSYFMILLYKFPKQVKLAFGVRSQEIADPRWGLGKVSEGPFWVLVMLSLFLVLGTGFMGVFTL